MMENIFEPLVRGSSGSAVVEGVGADMGLGLNIARELASAHGGSIRVASNAQDGTTFAVRLPRKSLATEASAR